jgi:hypothetical protein
MNRATTEIAATPIEQSFNISRASSVGCTPTTGTFTDDFQAEKHRLSGRPLRRPARRLPATSSAFVESDSEKPRACFFSTRCRRGAGSRRSSTSAPRATPGWMMNMIGGPENRPPGSRP